MPRVESGKSRGFQRVAWGPRRSTREASSELPRVLPGRGPGSSRENRSISNPQFPLWVRAEKVFHRRSNMPSLRHCRINTHSLRRCLAKTLSLMNRPCCAFIAMLLAVLQSTWSFKAFGVLCNFIRSHMHAFIHSVLSVVCCCRSPVASCPSLSAHPFACFLSVSIVIIVPLVVVIATHVVCGFFDVRT